MPIGVFFFFGGAACSAVSVFLVLWRFGGAGFGGAGAGGYVESSQVSRPNPPSFQVGDLRSDLGPLC